MWPAETMRCWQPQADLRCLQRSFACQTCFPIHRSFADRLASPIQTFMTTRDPACGMAETQTCQPQHVARLRETGDQVGLIQRSNKPCAFAETQRSILPPPTRL